MIPLLFFSLVVMIPGISESVPNTDDKIFQIFVEPDIVDRYSYDPKQGLFFTLNSNHLEDKLSVKIPKDFPIATTRNNTAIYDHMLIIGDGFELNSEFFESQCFYNYSVSLQNSTNVQFLYTMPPIGEPSIISNTVDQSCFEDNSDSIFPDTIPENDMCDKQLWMNLRSELVCIKESSVNALLERGYLIVDGLIKELDT